ncbi:MAG: signal peptidase II [Clostridia bacterium]|nr:signal peptidase II [Clostridia bacterium]
MSKNNFWNKTFTFLKGIILEAAIIVGGLFLDLLSKSIVENTMEYGQTVTVIPKLLNFSYTVNKRAAFGSDFGLGELIGQSGTMVFFIIFTLIAVGFFGYMLFKQPKKGLLYRISLALIIAGALGNLYDRAFLGGVRDFIQIEYLGMTIFGYKTFAIFNIADACVVVGATILIVFLVFFDDTFKDKKVKEEADNSVTHCEEGSKENAKALNEVNDLNLEINDGLTEDVGNNEDEGYKQSVEE